MLHFKITKQNVWVFSIVELAKLFVFKKCIMEWFAMIEFPLILLQNITPAKKKSFSSNQDQINQTLFATGLQLPP